MASNGKAEYATLEVLKEMMEIQDRVYRSTLQILVNDMKSEIKSVKKDVEELKLSTQFMSSKFADQKKNIEQRKMKVEQIEDRVKVSESYLSNSLVDNEYYDHESRLEDLENKHVYLKILGLPEEKNREKSWKDTEQIVKETINKEPEISSEEIQIEKAHRVGKPQDGRPRPVAARFCSWKQKEAILPEKRSLKTSGSFRIYPPEHCNDGLRSPKINPGEKKGNVAYFVLDGLVVHENKKEGPNGDILSSNLDAS